MTFRSGERAVGVSEGLRLPTGRQQVADSDTKATCERGEYGKGRRGGPTLDLADARAPDIWGSQFGLRQATLKAK
jgi:hypothetical protein